MPESRATFRKHTNYVTNNGLLILIATVIIIFAVVKMPLEMEILGRVGVHRRSIDDFYDHKLPRSQVDQRIDAKRSYSHFFNRDQQRSLRGMESIDQLKAAALRKEDEAMAQKVDEIVHRYLGDSQHEGTAAEQQQAHRHLRQGADKHMFSERVQHVVERFLGQKQHNNPQEDISSELVGDIPHERKEDDPFDKKFSTEVQDIVNRYTEMGKN